MNDLEKAIEVIKQGGIVIFPTDTAFGIGCRLDDESAVARLFEIRKRPQDKAIPVLFDSPEQVKEYVLPFDADVQRLMDEYWPGALTIVLSCDTSKVPSLVRGGGKTLGVRIPDNNTCLSLIKGAGIPILGPSANLHGQKTPYREEELDNSLKKLVDFVLIGKTKEIGKVSTVIDATNHPWKILREGEIKLEL